MRLAFFAALVLTAVGCAVGGGPVDGGASDAGEPLDAGADAGPRDAGEVDAGEVDAGDPDAGTLDAGLLTATFFPRVGNAADSAPALEGPGLVLAGGGTDVDGEFVWARATLSSSSTAPLGDVVVLRATGTNAYDAYILALAPFNSVQTILLPAPSTLTDLRAAAATVDRAEVVFFAGGDQSDYVAWAGSPLIAAVRGVYQRGGVVGGTSAGLAIQGQYAFDARVGSVTSAQALANPYEPSITFTRDLFDWPALRGAITDTHFATRDRFGRLVAFMARQHADGVVPGPAPEVLGLGVEQGCAVVVDKVGQGRLLRGPGASCAAYFVRGGPAQQVSPGVPLVAPGLSVTRLDGPAQRYDFTRRCGTGPTAVISVDARQASPYGGVDPYTVAGDAGSCP